ncbi:MAG: hypothetical protein LBE13_00815 [Bacteroidales bacterium]|jgi:hypothetical protein|nr:hypothetical protein [Bacteroidales bacterium]
MNNSTEKTGRDALFSRPTTGIVPVATIEKEGKGKTDNFFKEKYTQHSFRVPALFDEKVRNFHYTKVCATGDINYKLIDLYIDAMDLYIKKSKLEVQKRPDSVREKEKYHGRGASRQNRPKIFVSEE